MQRLWHVSRSMSAAGLYPWRKSQLHHRPGRLHGVQRLRPELSPSGYQRPPGSRLRLCRIDR